MCRTFEHDILGIVGIFRTHPPITEPELSPAMKARLDALSERLERHERIMKDLRLEWDEMYDKFRLLYARVAKRIKDAAAAAEADGNGAQSHQEPPGATKSRLTGYGQPPLTDRASPSRRNY